MSIYVVQPIYVTEFNVPAFKAVDEQHGIEDGGMAIMVHEDGEEEGGDGCFHVRLHSWDPRGGERPQRTREVMSPPLPKDSHPLMQSLFGQRVRVTVEVLEPNLNPAGWDDNAVREQIGREKTAKDNE
jgi:hypothetical protein